MTETNKPKPDEFIKYNLDNSSNPANKVIEWELKKINEIGGKKNKNTQDCIGLAISGGGIRSATFSLGVLQALAKNDFLKRFDYLSTVSGGGYLGSSLSFLLKGPRTSPSPTSAATPKTTNGDEDQNPPASKEKPSSGHDIESGKLNTAKDHFPFGYEEQPLEKSPRKAGLLRFLRQHGNYLFPGRGLTFLSFVAAYLRGFVMNFVVYFPWLTLALVTLFLLTESFKESISDFLPAGLTTWSGMFLGSAGLSLVFIISCIVYAVGTFVCDEQSAAYINRTQFSKGIRYLLILILILGILGLIEITDHGLKNLAQGKGDLWKQVTGLVSALAGLLSALKGFLKSGEQKSGGGGLWVIFGSIFLLFGLLLLSYQYHLHLESYEFEISKLILCSAWMVFFILLTFIFRIKVFIKTLLTLLIIISTTLFLKPYWDQFHVIQANWPWILFTLWLVASIILGWVTNLNFLSVHRYYRDRLMEAYMPDLSELFKGGWNEKWLGMEANNTAISHLCQYQLPYHLINTNVVLVDSWIPKFKGRGGDNFILSPYYCGSNATGWRSTKTFMNDKMTLPTAMAISGAALNPNTGVGGNGMTRNRMLSIVLNLLNLRLGYWAPNLDPKFNDNQKIYPNFLRPISFFFNHDERNNLIELSDGGHFENLALYELFRRRLKTIFIIDAGMDSTYTFEDLGNALEKARVDFGITVELKDLDKLVPPNKKSSAPTNASPHASSGFVVGTISYPKLPDNHPNNASIETEKFHGNLIYIKTTYMEGLPKDVVAYKNLNPLFPDQPTSDQFFDEKQFEAYRMLGHFIGDKMVEDLKNNHKDIYDLFR
ncbi:MAG: patatin-like phospholipase family protein [Nitrospinota bacterium]|nr:patatin-like phospholipase family protein [Nitrospinota bacterium]